MIHETPNYDSRLQSSELRISIQSTLLQRATGAKVPPVQKLTESKSVIQNLGVEDRNSESHVSGDRLYFICIDRMLVMYSRKKIEGFKDGTRILRKRVSFPFNQGVDDVSEAAVASLPTNLRMASSLCVCMYIFMSNTHTHTHADTHTHTHTHARRHTHTHAHPLSLTRVCVCVCVCVCNT